MLANFSLEASIQLLIDDWTLYVDEERLLSYSKEAQ